MVVRAAKAMHRQTPPDTARHRRDLAARNGALPQTGRADPAFQVFAQSEDHESAGVTELVNVTNVLSADVGREIYVKNRPRFLGFYKHSIRQALKRRSRALIATKTIECFEHTSPKRSRMGGLPPIKG